MVTVHFPVSGLTFGGSEHKPNASESSDRRTVLSLIRRLETTISQNHCCPDGFEP